MTERTIPQRELRNNIAAVLREAEGGAVFTVTVRGRPVARVGPVEETRSRRRDVDAATLRRILEMPVDAEFKADVEGAEPPIDWNDEPRGAD